MWYTCGVKQSAKGSKLVTINDFIKCRGGLNGGPFYELRSNRQIAIGYDKERDMFSVFNGYTHVGKYNTLDEAISAVESLVD